MARPSAAQRRAARMAVSRRAPQPAGLAIASERRRDFFAILNVTEGLGCMAAPFMRRQIPAIGQNLRTNNRRAAVVLP